MRKNPRLYEIHSAQWLHELSGTYGQDLTLGAVPGEEWDRLRDMGFQYVWLMGVWKRSKAGIEIYKAEEEYKRFTAHLDSIFPGWSEEDFIGSPYSIASYSPDGFIGSWDDLRSAKEALNSRGMGLVLDFVPNHTASDHPWVRTNPEYYIHGTEDEFRKDPHAFTQVTHTGKTIYLARGKDPYYPPWTDTLQLNHFNPGMRAVLLEEMKKISGYCDGLRCDMAMLVLNDIFARTWGRAVPHLPYEPDASEFWPGVRRGLGDTVLIAEAYWDTEKRLQEMGFDYVYDKGLYDHLKGGSVQGVRAHLGADRPFQEKLVRFIENHDEPRAAAAFQGGRLSPSAVLVSTLPGMRLYHHGQLEGRKIKTPVQLRRTPSEKVDKKVKDFYMKLLSITGQDVFHEGWWLPRHVQSVEDGSFENLVAYVWTGRGSLKLVVVNLGENMSQGRIVLKGNIREDTRYTLHDELNGKEYTRQGAEMAVPGLHVVLEGSQSHIFDITPAS